MQPVFARLDEFIARHMRETGAPGMTLALANRDGLIRASTYGYADTKAGLRVVPETMFEIGSVSKSFVGLAAVAIARRRQTRSQQTHRRIPSVVEDQFEV